MERLNLGLQVVLFIFIIVKNVVILLDVIMFLCLTREMCRKKKNSQDNSLDIQETLELRNLNRMPQNVEMEAFTVALKENEHLGHYKDRL